MMTQRKKGRLSKCTLNREQDVIEMEVKDSPIKIFLVNGKYFDLPALIHLVKF